jgi:hypothetical protein
MQLMQVYFPFFITLLYNALEAGGTHKKYAAKQRQWCQQ